MEDILNSFRLINLIALLRGSSREIQYIIVPSPGFKRDTRQHKHKEDISMEKKTLSAGLIPYAISACVFLILNFYSYAKIFEIPYIGFDFSPVDGTVIGIFTDEPAGQLIKGDRLLRVGNTDFEAYKTNLRQPLFGPLRSGEVVSLVIQRGDQIFNIEWVIPTPTTDEIIDRLNLLWMPYLFWMAGTATLLLVRPKDIRWRYLIAFYYLTALWLMFGLVSSGVIWHSAILLRVLTWWCVPIFLQLHWYFPRPLGSLPRSLSWGLSLGAAVMSGLEWFQLLPPSTYLLGFLLALGGSVALLIAHAVVQPDSRRELKLVAAAVVIIILPTFTFGTIAANFLDIPLWYGWGALLGLLALPGAYFYSIYRQQLGGLELRANRLITLYLFAIGLFIAFTVSTLVLHTWIEDTGTAMLIEVLLVLSTGLVIATGYPGFQRLVEHRLLGMPHPPTYLLEAYASKITTVADIVRLVQLLRDEILSSLLIRQSALLRLSEGNPPEAIYEDGIEREDLPEKADLPVLLQHSGKYLPARVSEDNPGLPSWLRVILPLEVGGELIGIWLLGSRDPDDYYAQSEVMVLKAIASQTAIALVNIRQAEHLHAIYQADIERQEKERARLARGLHDEVLNQLTVIALRQEKRSPILGFQESYEMISDYLRNVINELRPAMLAYGLRAALVELIDQLSERVVEDTVIQLDLPETHLRYEPDVELYLFRIVQQACENAIRHARARKICVYGIMDSERIQLIVEDDGVGFPAGDSLDLSRLLRERHYGLVGMYERAAFIGANLSIKSEPANGSKVVVNWRRKD